MLDASESELLHASVVRERLGLSEFQLRGLIVRGSLPSLKIGRRTYVPRRAFERYVAEINGFALTHTVSAQESA